MHFVILVLQMVVESGAFFLFFLRGCGVRTGSGGGVWVGGYYVIGERQTGGIEKKQQKLLRPDELLIELSV